MNSYPTPNSFLWELGSFQEYVKTISHKNRIYSPKFWLPTSPKKDNDTCSNCGNSYSTSDFNPNVQQNNDNVEEAIILVIPNSNTTSLSQHLITHNFWQFRMYPNGNVGHENYISIFLKAIITPYEKLNNVTSRKQQFLLEIGKLGPTTIISNYNLIRVPTRKQVIKQQVFEYTFEFDKDNMTCGFAKFCSLDLLFPDNDKSKEIDLFIQVTTLGEDPHRSNVSLLDDDAIDNRQQMENSDVSEEISDDIAEYFKSESFSDVEFLFDCGSTLKAHRIVLATRCNYFKTMFRGGFKESNLDVIPIRDVRYEVFHVVLFYIYTGKLMDLNEDVYSILRDSYKHSDLMGLTNLKRMVAKNIVPLIDNDNWHEILIMGWKFDDLLFRTKGLKYAKEHWGIIKYSDNLRDILNSSSIDCIEELFLVANSTAHAVR